MITEERKRNFNESFTVAWDDVIDVEEEEDINSTRDADFAAAYMKRSWLPRLRALRQTHMLYAEQHLTKVVDLKSAVKRLYEKLGALEFDADHEAIYGMEKYYTVEQCEKLRDKYKIGRKCLKDGLSKIRLQHFLDTINKDISNSDTSDKEEYKAVEQNGEGPETTKKESKKSKSERITKPVS
ncbi:hypothetical protein FQA39_LY13346 [Lamprigera yunnana]|nr:hypothetical protein FQA39_LY13346 [Lamprigera yunnana]